MKILFVTWDGPQVAYLEGLFLPIFQQLSNYGLMFHVLQFTWGDGQNVLRARAACESTDIPYRSVRVLRKPVAAGSFITAVTGSRVIRRAIRDWSIDVVMPRSTLPALATLLASRGKDFHMVFDADGLPIDERVDFSGLASSSFVYRLLRDVEAQAVRSADVVLARSVKAIEILRARAGAGTPTNRFHLVSNGRDADIFHPGDNKSRRSTREEISVDSEAPLLVYAGSLGEQYCLPEMLALFARVVVRRSDARLLILTGSLEVVPPALSAFPHLQNAVISLSVSPDRVPDYLSCADIGLALRKPSFSMQAVAPIKLGEYLLCGLPVIAMQGIGDTSAVNDDVGLLLGEMSICQLDQAANWVIETVLPSREAFRKRCNSVGKEYYSLESSANSYLSALQSVI